METTAKSYHEVLASNPTLVDYVRVVTEMIHCGAARKASGFSVEVGPIKQALEHSFFRIHGPRQSGMTLAIKELATEPTDLVLFKDLHNLTLFRENPLHKKSSALLRSATTDYSREVRANLPEFDKMQRAGKLMPIGEDGFKPKRIFLDESTTWFYREFDERSFIRWCTHRFGEVPLIIGL